MPRVSILISIFNGEAVLNRALKSILHQTYQDFEVICIDDYSTDKTPVLLQEWKEQLGERFVNERNQKNYGLTRSLNITLQKSTGEYIARLDADDWWEPTKLEKQVTFLNNHPEYGIVGTNHWNQYEHQEKLKEIRLPETHQEIEQKLFRRNPFAHSCIMARTSLLRKVGGYNENLHYGQDYDLWLRCFPLTKFFNIQEFLCTRAIDTLSVKKQDQQMWQSIKTRVKYIRMYRYGLRSYLYLLEPLGVILTPTIVKNWKRRYL